MLVNHYHNILLIFGVFNDFGCFCGFSAVLRILGCWIEFGYVRTVARNKSFAELRIWDLRSKFAVFSRKTKFLQASLLASFTKKRPPPHSRARRRIGVFFVSFLLRLFGQKKAGLGLSPYKTAVDQRITSRKVTYDGKCIFYTPTDL